MRKKDISELKDGELYHYRAMQNEKMFGEYMNKRFAILDHEINDKKNYLRDVWFRTRDDNMKGLMDFPTREVNVGEDTCLVYEIPREFVKLLHGTIRTGSLNFCMVPFEAGILQFNGTPSLGSASKPFFRGLFR